MVRSLGATGRRGRSQTSAAQDNQRRVARGPAARCAGRRPVAVKMQSGGSATRRDGASGLERRPPVGTRCATAQRTARRRVAGWFSVGATGRRGRPRTSVARDDKRRATRGPSAHCAGRRPAFQAVSAFGMGGSTRSCQETPTFTQLGGVRPLLRTPGSASGRRFGSARGEAEALSGWVGLRALRRCAPRAGRRPAFQAVCAIGMGGAACSVGGVSRRRRWCRRRAGRRGGRR